MDLTLPPDFKEFLKLLKEHDVRYLLIGGYAVGYHGYARATEDMDIWVAVHPDNAQKIVSALKAFGLDDTIKARAIPAKAENYSHGLSSDATQNHHIHFRG